MEKKALNLFNLLMRAGRSTVNGVKSIPTKLKNAGKDFITLKPAEREVIDKFKDAQGNVHDIYGGKSRFNLWDFVLPWKKSVVDHFWRNNWKLRPTFENYARYMKNHPKMGALKTAMGVAFPSSLPLTVTGLNFLDDATSNFSGEDEESSVDKGVRVGLGARLTGGAVAGALEASAPEWIKHVIPESIRRAGQVYNAANEYAPDKVREAKDYFNKAVKDTTKAGGRALLRAMNPFSNYDPSKATKSIQFLRDAKSRVGNTAAFGAGAFTGIPSFLTGTGLSKVQLDDRLKAEFAGLANGVIDDFALKGKDILDSAEDQLSLGISRSVLRDDIQRMEDKRLLRNSMRALRSNDKSYLDKAKAIIPLFNRALPGSYR